MPVYGPRRRMPGGTRLPTLQPQAHRGSLESIADGISEWIESMSADVAGSLLEGDRPPFSAPMAQPEVLEYYATTLFLPDGRINPAAWVAEQGRVGADGVAEAVRQGARWRRSRGLPVLLGPDPNQPAQAYGPMDQAQQAQQAE